MKKVLIIALLAVVSFPAFARKFMSRTARITFFSATNLQNIEAKNNEAACLLDADSGMVEFIIPIRSFKLEKALMEEHFNENYMESDKFPKAIFKGKVNGMSSVDFSKNGAYPVSATGKMTIHGVTKDVTIGGTIMIRDREPLISSKFNVECSDYGIKIPSVVAEKIAKTIEVTVTAPLKPLNR
ncbi:MAG: YceI family protein [Chitinophagaceae bacterium]